MCGDPVGFTNLLGRSARPNRASMPSSRVYIRWDPPAFRAETLVPPQHVALPF